LSGEGAKRAGQRWNSKGTAIAYTADSPAGCLLEAMVHVHDDGFPEGWRMLEFEVPDEAIEHLAVPPPGWDLFPYRPEVRAVGDAWAGSLRGLALSVPSALMKSSRNLLINPAHPAIGRVTSRDISDSIDVARIAARLRPG
jgi:RES domain-containing protein